MMDTALSLEPEALHFKCERQLFSSKPPGGSKVSAREILSRMSSNKLANH